MSEENRLVYGTCNGKTCYSREEFIYTRRGFGELQTDDELLAFAKKASHNWGGQIFACFHLSNYALSEPYQSLTEAEWKRLKDLQKKAKAEYEEEEAKFDYHRYEGRPLTEEEILRFLDRRIEREKGAQRSRGNDYWVRQLEEAKSEKMAHWKRGEVIEVDSYEYVDSYGNGTGSFAKVLMSDGTISTLCYGYYD